MADDPSLLGLGRPAARPDVVAVELDGEIVLYDELEGRLHVLNPSASLVWASLDGATTVASIAEDLAEAVGAPLGDVTAGVEAAVRDFEARGLLGDGGATAATPADPAPPRQQFLAEPRSGCQSCWDRIDAVGWVDRVFVDVGDALVVGVRTDSHDVAAQLRALAGSHVVDGADGPTPYSIEAGGSGRGVRALATLSHGFWPLWRSQDLDDVIEVLGRHAASQRPMPTGLVPVHAVALVGPAGAVLLPPVIPTQLEDVRVRFRNTDLRWIGTEVVLIDASTDELVVPVPTALTVARSPGAVSPFAPTGRHPLVGWVLPRLDEQTASPGHTAADLASWLRADPGQRVDAGTMAAWLDVVGRVPGRHAPPGDAELEAALELAAGSIVRS